MQGAAINILMEHREELAASYAGWKPAILLYKLTMRDLMLTIGNAPI